MSEPMTDGPNVHRPDAPFHEWTVLVADDADGNRHWFHVPSAALATLDRADPRYCPEGECAHCDRDRAYAALSQSSETSATPDRADRERRAEGLDDIRAAVQDATQAMSWALPVILAVRAWRDTPRHPAKKREYAALERAILDAINDFDEYAALSKETPA